MGRAVRRVYCLETDWWYERNRPSTVRPALELVRQVHPPFDFQHRCVATRSEFEYLLKQWGQRRLADHPLLYLAFHGSPRVLHIGDFRRSDSRVSLENIAAILDGRCSGRSIHFSACGTLNCDVRHLKRFCQMTGATAVTGYREDVDWLDSCLFEVQMIWTRQKWSDTAQGLTAVRREIERNLGRIAKNLGLRMVTKWD